MKNNILLLCAFIACLGLVMTSCGDDDVMGCTDPAANNYDPEATTDDGSCTCDRDPFIGTYIGDITFGMLTNFDTTGVSFTIETGVDASDKTAVIVNLVIAEIPLAFDSNVEGNKIPISAMLEGIPFTQGGFTIEVDINANGEVELNGNNLTGDLTLDVITIGLSDTVNIDAVKQ